MLGTGPRTAPDPYESGTWSWSAFEVLRRSGREWAALAMSASEEQVNPSDRRPADTTTNAINKRITSLREEGGAITLGRVLTPWWSLPTAERSSKTRSRRRWGPAGSTLPHHRRGADFVGVCKSPSGRPVTRWAATPCAAIGVLRTAGPQASTPTALVCSTSCPAPGHLVAGNAPDVPSRDPLGQLAIRRITDATTPADPLAAHELSTMQERHHVSRGAGYLLAGAAGFRPLTSRPTSRSPWP